MKLTNYKLLQLSLQNLVRSIKKDKMIKEQIKIKEGDPLTSKQKIEQNYIGI